MHILNITRDCQVTLQSKCTNLLSYPKRTRITSCTLLKTFGFARLNVFFFEKKEKEDGGGDVAQW